MFCAYAFKICVQSNGTCVFVCMPRIHPICHSKISDIMYTQIVYTQIRFRWSIVYRPKLNKIRRMLFFCFFVFWLHSNRCLIHSSNSEANGCYQFQLRPFGCRGTHDSLAFLPCHQISNVFLFSPPILDLFVREKVLAKIKR